MSNELSNYEKAELDYMNGLKYQDIADKYGVTINTVKSWKTRYKWDRKNRKKCAHKNEKVCTQKEAVAEGVEQIVENNNLTDEQRLFCCYYVRCFNATKAYMKAYGVSYNVAAAAGCRLLKKKKIQEAIKELKQNRLNREMLSEDDIFQKYMDIAFSDMNDYFKFGSAKGINYGFLRNSDEIDGSMISEIKISHGKVENVSIKLLDKMKALQWLSEHMDMATEEQRARINKLNVEINRATGKGNEDELTKVDELLEQIRKQAGEAYDTKS